VNYRIIFSPDGLDQLHELSARLRAVVLDQIERQLTHQPAEETRNRKRMRENPLAPWELRVGDLRVYYDLRDEPQPTVLIRAVGVKVRNQLMIGGKAVRL
jgi:mRNA interferase RelE/StbE